MIKTKLALAALTLGLASLQALYAVPNEVARIEVNTFVDENGQNSRTCSLREAVQAAVSLKPFGGCPAGVKNFIAKIYLQPGLYTLRNGEIVLPSNAKGNVRIVGAVNIVNDGSLTLALEDKVEEAFKRFNNGVLDFVKSYARLNSEFDYITKQAPQRRVLETIIDAGSRSRIINSELSTVSIELFDLELINGKACNELESTGTAPNDVITCRPSTASAILGGDRQGYGGLILTAGSLLLERVSLKKGEADADGGAIYLAGNSASLSMSQTSIESSEALGEVYDVTEEDNVRENVGAGAIGMSCLSSTSASRPTINISRSSITGNTGKYAIIDLCGKVNSKIDNTTIATNTLTQPAASTFAKTALTDSKGEFIGSAAIRYLNLADDSEVSRSAKLELANITLMENTGDGLFYDGSGDLDINSSVLAFNTGKDCVYAGVDTLSPKANVSLSNNLLVATTTTPPVRGSLTIKIASSLACELPFANSSTDTTFYDSQWTGTNTLTTLFNDLDNYGAWLKGYLPKLLAPLGSNVVVDKGKNASDCAGEVDQRGINRRSGFNDQDVQAEETPRCDIGALELSQLTANDMLSAINLNYKQVALKKRFFLPDELPEEFAQLALEDKLLELVAYNEESKKINDLKKYYQYRTAFANVLTAVIRPEVVGAPLATNDSNDGVMVRTTLEDADFATAVTTVSYGTSVDDWNARPLLLNSTVPTLCNDEPVPVGGTVSPQCAAENALECTYNADLKVITMRRKAVLPSGVIPSSITPAGKFEHCVYTVTSGGQTSRGVIQGRIVNIAPTAEAFTVTMPRYSVSKTISQREFLTHADDLGDGPVVRENNPDVNPVAPVSEKETFHPLEGLFYELKPDFTFMLDANNKPKKILDFEDNKLTVKNRGLLEDAGKPAFIQIIDKPKFGTLVFEHDKLCPSNVTVVDKQGGNCKGGNAVYTVKNTFNPFDEQIRYRVIDADGTVSPTVTLTIDTVDEKAAKGSLGTSALLGLLMLALARRKAKLV